MGPKPRPISHLPLLVVMDWEEERNERIVSAKSSTINRTQGICVLIVIGFLVFYLLDFGTKIEQDETISETKS